MSKTTVLNERVVGRLFEVARHPRVELPSIRSLLEKRPVAEFSIDVATAPRAALAALAASACGALLVVDGGQLRGLVGEHDIVRNLLAGGYATASLADLLAPCGPCATPADTLEDGLRLIAAGQLRHLAVVDGGTPVGLLSRDELLAAKVAYLERICKESELDQQVAFLRGTYSC